MVQNELYFCVEEPLKLCRLGLTKSGDLCYTLENLTGVHQMSLIQLQPVIFRCEGEV